jgi:hypothetical protein
VVLARTRWMLVSLWLLAACGGRARSNGTAVVGEESDAGTPVSCAGVLGAEPTVLRSDVGDGWLFLEGERLISVEAKGRVRSIDRCSGDATELVTLPRVTGATVAGGYAWVASADDLIVLRRVSLRDGSADIVGGSPGGYLVSDESHVYFTERRPPEPLQIVRLTANAAATRSTRPLPNEWGLRLLRAGPAGLYVTEDCDCVPRLRRLPHDSSELLSVEGTNASSIVTSFSSVLVHRDELYVSLNPAWVRRLPLEGGEPETLLANSAASELNAQGDDFCWLEGSYDGPGWVRCLSLADPKPVVRAVDHVESGRFPRLVLASGAAYWLRPLSADVTQAFELVAAAL